MSSRGRRSRRNRPRSRSKTKICPSCEGTGTAPELGKFKCPVCDGAGMYPVVESPANPTGATK